MANQIKFNDIQFAVGDTVAVHHKVKEGDKERLQVFEGIVIAIKGSSPENKSFIIRKIANGKIGVERIWPLMCPSISKIKLIKKAQVRRAKLYYLRKIVGKNALRVKADEQPKLRQNRRRSSQGQITA